MRNKFYIKLLIMLMASINASSTEFLKPAQPPQYSYDFNKFRPPSSPEPTFIQRITSWFFPWGGVSNEENVRLSASPKIDKIQNPANQHSSIARIQPFKIRDTEPTTVKPTEPTPISKCSPCNKVPWIPMMPTYQLPLVNARPDQHQIYFKHQFGNENQYTQISQGYKYESPKKPTLPIKTQASDANIRSHKYYGVPTTRNAQYEGSEYSTKSFEYSRTTIKPNFNTIDTSVITFTTSRTQNKRPLRFTAASSVTNPEYILPPNVLPLEGENSQLVPIPIPNLSPTPIPPLFDSKNFHHDPYRSQKVGFIKLVPLEPDAQLSNNINVQVRPDTGFQEFVDIKRSPAVEVINSNLVAEFMIPEKIDRSKNVSSPKNFKLDNGNNIENQTTRISSIKIEPLESVTDNVIEESEDSYQHEVNQTLELAKENDKNVIDEAIETEESNGELKKFKIHANSVETTTEGKYTLKFEPSIQTAADLVEKALNLDKTRSLWRNRHRLTPLEFLDSPIFHVTPFTTSPEIVEATESLPPFKPVEDYSKNLSTLWGLPIFSSTQSTQSLKSTANDESEIFVSSTHSSLPKTTIPMLSTLSDVSTLKHPPVKNQYSTKKPKNMQIVIPYTSYQKPSPFKIQEEQEILTYRPLVRGHYVTRPSQKTESIGLFNGQGYHNDQEYPDHAQESKIVESKVTVMSTKPTKYLTKILANNIRDLLTKEKTSKPPKVDIIRLQKNIDGWTEQSFLGKASTISQTGHTKTIPVSFLSTTVKGITTMSFRSTISPKQTFESELMEEMKQQYDKFFLKKDLYVKRHDRFLNRDNELVLINNNLTHYFHHDGVKVFAPRTTMTPKELWKRLHFTVSPITNEKVYIVTPQPPQAQNQEINTLRPRFSKRPTVSALDKTKQIKLEKQSDIDNTPFKTTYKRLDSLKDTEIVTPEKRLLEEKTTTKLPHL